MCDECDVFGIGEFEFLYVFDIFDEVYVVFDLVYCVFDFGMVFVVDYYDVDVVLVYFCYFDVYFCDEWVGCVVNV